MHHPVSPQIKKFFFIRISMVERDGNYSGKLTCRKISYIIRKMAGLETNHNDRKEG